MAIDDYAASTATVGTLSVGGTCSGSIESADDEDWFRIELAAGNIYHFEAQSLASSAGTLEFLDLEVYDGLGQHVGGDFGAETSVTFTATSSGAYYVGASSLWIDFGSYTVSAAILGTTKDDYAASTATTGTLAVDGTSTGVIGSIDDNDWFKIKLTAGDIYHFEALGLPSGDGTLASPEVEIYDSLGRLVASGYSSGSGHNSSLTFAATSSKTYYVGASSRYHDIGTYTVSATKVGTINDDYAASTSTTGTLEVGGTSTGVIGSVGDEDWFAVTLTAGSTCRFEVLGLDSSDGTLVNPRLDFHDSSGLFIASIGGSSPLTYDSFLSFTATSSGTYYVGASGDEIGTYTVAATNAETSERLVGNTYGNAIRGMGGRDTIFGSSGGDRLDGDWGNDRLFGEWGDDYLFGGRGSDFLSGGGQSDRLEGGNGDDSLTGITGYDILCGGAGNDLLFGGIGNDSLVGDAGADVLYGGTGNDSLTGGTGTDVFVFNSAVSANSNTDVITDFSVADDTIKLQNSGKGLFTNISTGTLAAGAFHKGADMTAATEVDDRIIYNTSTGDLYYDADGSGAAHTAIQFAIVMTPTDASLTSANFVAI